MDKLKRVSVEHRDNFVAYLDGELSPDESKNLERVLADSPVARKDVELLVRTYDMLELLPRPAATVEFTQKTMTTIKLSDMQPDVTQTAWYKWMHLGIVAAAATGLLVFTGLLAYAGTSRWFPTEEDLLLRDLQVIKNLDQYTQVDQLDFLNRLQGQSRLLQEIQDEVRNTHGL